jgi:predicted DNA-binding protein with PD1-like motif
MEFKQFGANYLVRLQRGEEVVSALTDFVRAESIQAGSISGIGAVSDLSLGFFDPTSREYIREDLAGGYEVVNLAGNVSVLAGEEMLHLHATVADIDHRTRAGHLFQATVSVTLEVVVTRFDGRLERRLDESVGLNLLDLG